MNINKMNIIHGGETARQINLRATQYKARLRGLAWVVSMMIILLMFISRGVHLGAEYDYYSVVHYLRAALRGA
jgi:hypothetical protein